MTFRDFSGWALLLSWVLLTSQAAAEEKAWPLVRVEKLFVLTGSPGVPFRQPTDVAIGPTGRIYVLDGLNSRVAVFNGQGVYLYSFGSEGSGPGQLLMPVGIGVSTGGEVCIADSGNHRIQVFASKGEPIAAFPLKGGENADPTDVLPLHGGKQCYVVDNENHEVQAYDMTTGRFLWGWGGYGKDLGEFRYPATIAADRHDNVYVVDVMNARVQTFEAHGEDAREIVSWGVRPGRVFRPKGVAIDSEERVFVSDSYMGYIQVFRNWGTLYGIVGDTKGKIRGFTTPTNIVIDNRERLFVVETRAGQVSAFQILHETK